MYNKAEGVMKYVTPPYYTVSPIRKKRRERKNTTLASLVHSKGGVKGVERETDDVEHPMI